MYTDALRTLRDLRKNLPEVFDMLQAKFKNDLYQKSMVKLNGQKIFSPKAFVKNVEKLKLSKEMKSLVFGDTQAYLLNTVEKAANALPEKLMKGSAEWLSMQGGLAAQAWREASDAAVAASIYLAPKMKRAIESQDSQIKTKLLNFLDRSQKVIKPAVLQGTLSVSQDDSKRIERVMELSSNPEELAQVLAENTRGLAETDYDVANVVSESVVRAADFLSQKAPKKPDSMDMFSEPIFQPSDAAIAKFNRYLKAVDVPLSIMDDLESGVLQPESVEAVAYVYPRLYKRITTQAMEQIKQGAKIPYSDKIQFATLLQMPVSSTMTPQFIRAMQADNIDPMKSDAEVMNEQKTNVTGLKDLSVAQSTKTATQQTLTRA